MITLPDRHCFRVRQCKYQTISNSTFELGKILYKILPGEMKCLSDNEFKIIVVRLICKYMIVPRNL